MAYLPLDVAAGAYFGDGWRGPAMGIPSRLDAFRLGRGARFSMCPDVIRREGMRSFDAVFDIRRKLAGAQRRTVLDADVVHEKERQIHGYDRLFGHFALVHDIEAKRTGVLQLIETEI